LAFTGDVEAGAPFSTCHPDNTMEDRVLVEYGVFGLMDLDVAGCPRPWPQEPLAADTVTAIRNRVDVPSAARDHEAAVRLESSPDPPQATGGEEVELELTSGRVRLWTVTMGPSEHVFTVGPPGPYRLRVTCDGHDDAAALSAAGRPVPDGTERYRLRFWPY
jgi:hypothetical protein